MDVSLKISTLVPCWKNGQREFAAWKHETYHGGVDVRVVCSALAGKLDSVCLRPVPHDLPSVQHGKHRVRVDCGTM